MLQGQQTLMRKQRAQIQELMEKQKDLEVEAAKPKVDQESKTKTLLDEIKKVKEYDIEARYKVLETLVKGMIETQEVNRFDAIKDYLNQKPDLAPTAYMHQQMHMMYSQYYKELMEMQSKNLLPTGKPYGGLRQSREESVVRPGSKLFKEL